MVTFNEGYELIKISFIEQRIPPQQYIDNAKSGIIARNNLKKFLMASKDEIVQLMATIRILLKDKPILLAFIRLTSATHYDDKFKRKRAEEETKIKKEIDDLSIKSADRIKATLQRSADNVSPAS